MSVFTCFQLFAVLGCTLSVSWAQDQHYEDNKFSNLLYTVQPVEELSCDPYIGRSFLRCAVYLPKELGNITIRWYKREIYKGVTQNPVLLREIGPRPLRKLFVTNYRPQSTEIVEGYYWCQAYLEGESFVPSVSLRLFPHEEYEERYPPCNELILSQPLSMFAVNGTVLPPAQQASTGSSSNGTTNTPQGMEIPSANSTVLQADVIAWIVTAAVSVMLVVIVTILLLVICLLWSKRRQRKGDITSSISTANQDIQSPSEVNSLRSPFHHFDVPPLPGERTEQQRQSQGGYTDSYGYMDIEHTEIHHPLSSNGVSAVPLPATSDFQLQQSLPQPSQSANVNAATEASTVHYRAIDEGTMDKDDHLYTDRRKPPPVMAKKPALKSLSLSSKATQSTRLAVLVDNPGSPPDQTASFKKREGKESRPGLSTGQSRSLPARQYQALDPSTTNSPVYTSPQSTPNAPLNSQKPVYHYAN